MADNMNYSRVPTEMGWEVPPSDYKPNNRKRFLYGVCVIGTIAMTTAAVLIPIVFLHSSKGISSPGVGEGLASPLAGLQASGLVDSLEQHDMQGKPGTPLKTEVSAGNAAGDTQTNATITTSSAANATEESNNNATITTSSASNGTEESNNNATNTSADPKIDDADTSSSSNMTASENETDVDNSTVDVGNHTEDANIANKTSESDKKANDSAMESDNNTSSNSSVSNDHKLDNNGKKTENKTGVGNFVSWVFHELKSPPDDSTGKWVKVAVLGTATLLLIIVCVLIVLCIKRAQAKKRKKRIGKMVTDLQSSEGKRILLDDDTTSDDSDF